jgi:general secretion pathway protein J
MVNKFMPRYHKGFTLIELLVALVIFAILSALSYRSLSALIQTKTRIELETHQWRQVMLFFNRLDNDLRQVVNRPIRIDQQMEAAFLGQPTLQTQDDAQLSFSRLGSPMQSGTLMDTQRIAYRHKTGNIEMLIWPAMDIESTTKPKIYTVLSGVKSMSLRYMQSRTHAWVNAWPLTTNTPEPFAMPKAMEIQIVLKSGEVLQRTYLLP